MSGWWRRVLFRNVSSAVALLVLVVIAGATALYILDNQRLRLPLLDEPAFELHAEFATAQAIIPGQGQTLNVSGVRVGDVTEVRLRDGRAVVTFDVDERYRGVIRKDAELLMRPRTGLKDMFVEVDPGDGEPAPPGWTLPVAQTQPDVNTDEILAMLDADTRDYVELLLQGAAEGLEGRGSQLADVFRRLGPTHRHIKRVAGAVRTRERNLRRLVGRLERISATLAREDEQVARLVGESAKVFRAFAREEQGIRASLRAFPEALRATTDALERAGGLGRALQDTEGRVRPVVRELTAANEAIAPAAREVAPLLRREVRPFVRELRPLVRDLPSPARKVATASPDFRRTLRVLNRLFNMIAFNQDGAEGPRDPDRDEGYLFWSSWLSHNGNILFNHADAHGTLRPIAFASACNTLRDRVAAHPELEFLMGLTAVLTSPEACGEQPPPALRRSPFPARERREAAR